MKKIVFVILSLVIISMFLVGCAKESQEKVDVVDEQGNIVGEAFRHAPGKYKLNKGWKELPQKLPPKKNSMPKMDLGDAKKYLKLLNKCKDGSLPVMPAHDVGYPPLFVNKCLNHKAEDNNIKAVYICAPVVPISSISCPGGSVVHVEESYWKGATYNYECYKENSPFSETDVKCPEGMKLWDSDGATTEEPNLCVKHTILDNPNGNQCMETIDFETNEKKWVCCEKSVWAFGCTIDVDLPYNNCDDELINLDNDFPSVSCCAEY